MCVDLCVCVRRGRCLSPLSLSTPGSRASTASAGAVLSSSISSSRTRHHKSLSTSAHPCPADLHSHRPRQVPTPPKREHKSGNCSVSQGVCAFLEIGYLAGKKACRKPGSDKSLQSQHLETVMLQKKTNFLIPAEKTSTAGHRHMFWLVVHSMQYCCTGAPSWLEEKGIIHQKLKCHQLRTLVLFLICMTFCMTQNMIFLKNIFFKHTVKLKVVLDPTDFHCKDKSYRFGTTWS